MKSLLICLTVLLSSILATAQPRSLPGAGAEMRVSDSIRLAKSANGVDGALELLTDSRLTETLKKEMWGVGDWSFVLPETDSRYAEFKSRPPRNAELRIISADRRVLTTLVLEQPLASLATVRLVGDGPSFFVTVDYSIGFGSYAGLTALPLNIKAGRIEWIEAINKKTNRYEKIRLPNTLKTAWKLVPVQGGQNILLVYCRPANFGAEGFVISYVRYNFDGKSWVKREKTDKGFWEAEDGFPPISKFP